MSLKLFMPLLALSMLSLLVACPNTTPTPPEPKTGTLAITFSNDNDVPASLEGDVLISGPNGFSRTLKRSEGLSVPAGTYTVKAKIVRVSGAVVDRLFEGDVESAVACCKDTQDVVVTENLTTAVSVSYDETANSGTLHLIGKNLSWPVQAAVLEAGTGNASASRQVCDTEAQGAALDANQHLWVACSDAGTLREYKRMDFNPPSLVQTITLPSGTKPRGIAFDKAGNLWVVDASATDRVLEFAKSDLALGVGGALTPVATVIVPETLSGANDKAEGLAFDQAGNLWVSTFTLDDSLLKYEAATLTQNPKPSVILTFKSAPFPGVNFSLFTPKSIAFDKDGNLWASNQGNNTIAKFSAPFTTGTPTPALMLTNVSDKPGAIAFDNASSLWVGVAGKLLKFGSTKLTNTGAVSISPDVTLKASVADTSSATAAVFMPAPLGLPLAP